MSQELQVREQSRGLIETIIEAEAAIAVKKQEITELQAKSDAARAQVLTMFKERGLKTISLENGNAITAASRTSMKITDEPALIRGLDELQVGGFLTDIVPEHREVLSAKLTTWLKEKGEPARLGLKGIEFKKTEYLVIKAKATKI